MEYEINIARPVTNRERQLYGGGYTHYFRVIVL